MIEKFVEEYAKLIVEFPQDIKIKVSEKKDVYEIDLFAHKEDLGKLIGRDGRMIGAIKNVISGCKSKNYKNYKINVELSE
jgi:predicted RNA-binding protein YlqC (UPF0109 family)